jgi:hypothetical protein
MRKSLPRLAIPVLLVPLLAGCGLFESKQTRAMRATPDYKAGYSDGCATAGSVSANPRADTSVRDDQAFEGNEAYRMGWGEGFGACRPMTQAPLGGGLGAPRY